MQAGERGKANQRRKHELQPADPLQDAERQRAGLGSDNDRPPLGDDSKRGDDRIRPAADRGDKPAIVCVRAESAEGAEEKVGGVASKHEL